MRKLWLPGTGGYLSKHHDDENDDENRDPSIHGALERDPAIDAWMIEHAGGLWEPSRIGGLR